MSILSVANVNFETTGANRIEYLPSNGLFNIVTTGNIAISSRNFVISNTPGTTGNVLTSNGTAWISQSIAQTIGITGLANTAITGIKTATFQNQLPIATTTGAITIDWTSAQNYRQVEPTGTITYTFTAPPGPCHLQLLIDSDGTSTAQTINWPGTLIWLGNVWAGVNNKKSVINLWYDGTNYYAIGTNQP